MLSNALGITLLHDKTALYYNNEYPPSITRLGANTMENALFSKEIVNGMLSSKRITTGGYVTLWIILACLPHNNLNWLTWITQIVFSGTIITQWVSLEFLRIRYERTFEQLHFHFVHNINDDSLKNHAIILDAFAEYESAKSSAGCLLSSKVFSKLNTTLTDQWKQIREELKMI